MQQKKKRKTIPSLPHHFSNGPPLSSPCGKIGGITVIGGAVITAAVVAGLVVVGAVVVVGACVVVAAAVVAAG